MRLTRIVLFITPGLDENRVIGDFVYDIWIFYKVHCTKVLYNALHNIFRCRVQCRQWRDSHPDQVCTKRGQPGKLSFDIFVFWNHCVTKVKILDTAQEQKYTLWILPLIFRLDFVYKNREGKQFWQLSVVIYKNLTCSSPKAEEQPSNLEEGFASKHCSQITRYSREQSFDAQGFWKV